MSALILPTPPPNPAPNNYGTLVTSEHQKPNFLGVIQALTQGHVDNQQLLENLNYFFDLDTAIGAQLDRVGQWVGQSRNLQVPLDNVYFSFDENGVGLGQGTWWGPLSPLTQLDILPDDTYRNLLKAKIAANQWDGSIPKAYAVWNSLFTTLGLIIQDNGDMTMEVGVLAATYPDAVTLALLTGGYLNLKPAGVRINNYWTPSILATPYFGFDTESAAISGLGVGAWGLTSSNRALAPLVAPPAYNSAILPGQGTVFADSAVVASIDYAENLSGIGTQTATSVLAQVAQPQVIAPSGSVFTIFGGVIANASYLASALLAGTGFMYSFVPAQYSLFGVGLLSIPSGVGVGAVGTPQSMAVAGALTSPQTNIAQGNPSFVLAGQGALGTLGKLGVPAILNEAAQASIPGQGAMVTQATVLQAPVTWIITKNQNQLTVFNYGAVGDGVTDDSAAFRAALADSFNNRHYPILVPAAKYKINSTINFSPSLNNGQPWGLRGQEATLISGITNGTDIMQVLHPGNGADIRYLQITGLNFVGTGTDGYGLRLIAPDGNLTDFYNNLFADLQFKGMGLDGLMMDGNIFETSVDRCSFNGNNNGLSCMHDFNGGGSKGICSSISVSDCDFINNRNYGLQVGIIGASFGGASDIVPIGCRFRGNGSYGAYYNQGMFRGIIDCKFVDNSANSPINSPTGAHVYAGIDAKLKNCLGQTSTGGSTYLLRVYAFSLAHMTDCTHVVGPNPTVNPNGLGMLLLGGVSGGFGWLENCRAPVGVAIDTAAGNAAVWRANNCTGTSPNGALNPTGQVGTV